MGNRIDPLSGPRISTNVSVERQTPKTDFGTRVQAGVGQAAGVVGAAANFAAPLVPGAGILSAAVSSVGTMASQFGSGAVGAQYSKAAGAGVLNTTVDSSTVPGGSNLGQVNFGNVTNNQSINQGLSGMQNDNNKMLELQIAMQRENTVFSAISNVLKVRHDTQKNSIGNVR